jgi:hypothetical protein
VEHREGDLSEREGVLIGPVDQKADAAEAGQA